MFKPELKDIPENPGIYTYIGKNDEILYVGKAKNLKNRVSSYFSDMDSKPLRTQKMLQSAVDIRFVVTTTEAEALLLENNLIKTEKPRYNVRLKDSKSYPYILITDDEYPKLMITRESGQKGEYFGPFTDVAALRGIVDELLRAFPLRTCRESRFREKKVCLKYQIKQCAGPCESLISRNRYLSMVSQIRDFFNGDFAGLKERMTAEMMRLSDRMEFEAAAKLRDRLRSVEGLFIKQTVVLPEDRRSIDIFVPHTIDNVSGITVMFIRGGKLIGSRTDIFEDVDPKEVLESYVIQVYSSVVSYPEMISVFDLDETDVLCDAVERMSGRKIILRKRGFAALHNLGMENARVQTELYMKRLAKRKDISARLKEITESERDIRRVECVDISHLGGKGTVGVSVVTLDGEFANREYRKYKIKSAENDDFVSIYELFSRKFENIKENSEPLADLYIVDGGIGQLNSAVRAAEEQGVDANFISISKGRSIKYMKDAQDESIESIHIPNRKNPLNLKKNNPVLLFVQKIRDESHRFAITYSRSLALKNFKRSPLLDIDGVGEKTVKKILENFPDIYSSNISAEELSKICRISGKLAETILSKVKSGQ
ncbi:MAG: excinuclease ABC subunit UvrC [Deferribacterales bacterium]